MSENSRKLKAEGLPHDITEDQLRIILANKRRLGGGPVESVELNKDGDTCFAVVTFKESDAVDLILSRGDKILINQVQATVERFDLPESKPSFEIYLDQHVTNADTHDDEQMTSLDLSKESGFVRTTQANSRCPTNTSCHTIHSRDQQSTVTRQNSHPTFICASMPLCQLPKMEFVNKVFQYTLQLNKFGFMFLKNRERILKDITDSVHCKYCLSLKKTRCEMTVKLDWPEMISAHEVKYMLQTGVNAVWKYLDIFKVTQFTVARSQIHDFQKFCQVRDNQELPGMEIFFDHKNNLAVFISDSDENLVKVKINNMYHNFLATTAEQFGAYGHNVAVDVTQSWVYQQSQDTMRQQMSRDKDGPCQDTMRQQMSRGRDGPSQDNVRQQMSIGRDGPSQDNVRQQMSRGRDGPCQDNVKLQRIRGRDDYAADINKVHHFLKPNPISKEREKKPSEFVPQCRKNNFSAEMTRKNSWEFSYEQILELEEKDIILFEATNFHKDVEKTKPLTIILDTERRQAVIKANDKNTIYCAQVELLKKARDFMSVNIKESFSPEQAQLLKRQDVQTNINKHFKDNGFQAHFRCDTNMTTLFYIKGINDALLMEVINSQVVVKQKPLNDDMVLAFQSEKGHKFLSELCEGCDGVKRSSQVKLHDKNLLIVTSSQHQDVFMNAINHFAEENKSVKKHVPFSSAHQNYVQKFLRQDMENIKSSLISLGAKIIETPETITVQGLQDGVFEGEKKLTELSERIFAGQTALRYFGIKEFLQHKEGISLLTNVENSKKCTFVPKTTTHITALHSVGFQKESAQSGLVAHATVGGCTIYFIQGDITDLATDAIVNPLESSLLLRSGLSKALISKGISRNNCDIWSYPDLPSDRRPVPYLDLVPIPPFLELPQLSVDESCMSDIAQGGPSIQAELASSRLQGFPRTVVQTTAGQLGRCKAIIHVVCPVYTGTERDVHEVAVSACLKFIAKQGHKSVAFPALGAGDILQFPDQMACTVLMKSLHQHLAAGVSSLRNIYLCDIRAKCVMRFIESFKVIFENSSAQAIPPVSDHIELEIYAGSTWNVRNATAGLNEAIRSAFKEEKENNKDVKRLDRHQVKKLEDEGRKHLVDVSVSVEEGLIAMKSFKAEGFLPVEKLLRQMLLEAVENNHKFLHAVAVSAKNRQYKQATMTDFDRPSNSALERQFRLKSYRLDIADPRGRRYHADVMEENPFDDSGQPYGSGIRVKRYHSIKEGEPLPKRWESMQESENLKLIHLHAGSEEYMMAAALFINGGVSKPIRKIQRIQNKSLYQQYKAKKREIDHRNGTMYTNERRLFHGTDAASVTAINENGFNRSYCGKNATVYGNGVYFAVKSSYSKTYTHLSPQGECYMYIARVLTGVSTPGKAGMNYLPNQPGTAVPYDFGKAGENYVIFHDAQAYPEYLITF